MAGIPGQRSGGKNAKPSYLKSIAGNPGKRPLNEREPPATGAPVQPRGLTPRAKAEWRLQVTELHPALLARMDQATLAAHCEVVSLMWTAKTDIAERGATLYTEEVLDDGRIIVTDVKKNPSVTTFLSCTAQIRSFAAEFGLSPAARSRITVPEASRAKSSVERHFG